VRLTERHLVGDPPPARRSRRPEADVDARAALVCARSCR
jgi:hypothetical protein